MLKIYIIAQKLLQTDLYTVEAETEQQALEIYDNIKGTLMSNGSTNGWACSEHDEVVVIKPIEETK